MELTTDIWFTLFLMKEKEIDIDHYDVETAHNGRKKAKFFFKLSKDEWKILKLEFNRSLYTVIKYGLEEIKDLVH